MHSSQPNPFADSPINPYAPPQGPSLQPVPLEGGAFNGLWRQGKILIMHRQAQLPPICVKSNEPAEAWLQRKLQWHPRWVLVLALINIPIFAIVAFLTTKRATINIGLTQDWISRRKMRMNIAWLSGLVGVLLIAAGVLTLSTASSPQPEDWRMATFAMLLTSGIVVCLGAVIGGSYGCRMVHADRVTDTHLYIKGVHPEFLDRLPVWYG